MKITRSKTQLTLLGLVTAVAVIALQFPSMSATSSPVKTKIEKPTEISISPKQMLSEHAGSLNIRKLLSSKGILPIFF
ncbi:hypothetical protein FUAX_19710 [Fulvitalea axinellae]|uniref:Uncharacterized protein n=1 Tax=Fulvitalea axinellae TaxID=1182444 RepID=A0AAU9CBP1_9BACT|nr:hypothetical protein FUAX_19710 [Fulvitalea axinellae]